MSILSLLEQTSRRREFVLEMSSLLSQTRNLLQVILPQDSVFVSQDLVDSFPELHLLISFSLSRIPLSLRFRHAVPMRNLDSTSANRSACSLSVISRSRLSCSRCVSTYLHTELSISSIFPFVSVPHPTPFSRSTLRRSSRFCSRSAFRISSQSHASYLHVYSPFSVLIYYTLLPFFSIVLCCLCVCVCKRDLKQLDVPSARESRRLQQKRFRTIHIFKHRRWRWRGMRMWCCSA